MIVITSAVLVVLAGAATRAAWLAASSATTRARFANRSRGGLPLRSAPPRWLLERAARAGLRPEVIVPFWPASVAVAGVVVLTSTGLFGLPGLIAATLLLVAAPPLAFWRLAAAEKRRRARALPVLLEEVARGLRSGASLRQALELSVDRADVSLRAELGLVCDTVARGGSLEVALGTWCARQPCEGLRVAVAALVLGIDAGAAHGRALDGVAASLRDRLAVNRELVALSSQAQASAAVMAAAPVVFAVFAVTADRRSAHFLLGTSAGLTCLAAGLLLDGIAAWWMFRLTGAVRCEI